MDHCLNCQAPIPSGATSCPACRADVPLWIARDGQTFGPYTLAALQQAQAEGRLGLEDQIMIGNGGVWQPLAMVLQPAAAKPAGWAPPPPPPPPRAAAAVAQRKSQDQRQVLIVVLIVGGLLMFLILPILAAIMFPVFAKSREKARQSSCLSNLKQLNMAMVMYAQEYDERFPPKPRSQAPQRLENGRSAVERGLDMARDYPPGDWRWDTFHELRNDELYVCPTTRSAYSYQCNPALYDLSQKDVWEPGRVIQLYDNGLLDRSSPPPHNQGYNAGFVDGHCLWTQDTQRFLTAPSPARP